MRGIDILGFGFVATQHQNSASDFVLTVGRQPPYTSSTFSRSFVMFCRIGAFLYKMKTTDDGETR
jgi:hypothetical protein